MVSNSGGIALNGSSAILQLMTFRRVALSTNPREVTTAWAIGLALSVLVACSHVGSYATSLGITNAAQLEGARADFKLAIMGFVNIGVLTKVEGRMELTSEEMRLGEGTWSKAYTQGYRLAVLRDIPHLSSYQRQCSWVGPREDVQCKGKRFIAELGRGR